MKTILKSNVFVLLLFAMINAGNIHAQQKGNGNVAVKSYETGAFDRILVGGALKMVIIPSEKHSVNIETDDNLFDQIQVVVKGSTLEIIPRHISNSTKLEAVVALPSLSGLKAEGATNVSSDELLEGESLELEASGASKLNLALSYENLVSSISGAVKLTLEGHAGSHKVNMSGASKLAALDLETENTVIVASGASSAKVWAVERLDANVSGAASVSFDKQPMEYNLNDNSFKTKIPGKKPDYAEGDSVTVKVGNINVKVIEGDTTRVNIGGLNIEVDEKGNVNVNRKRRHKFNGHWAGVELGLNGYLTPDFNMSFPASQSYLDLRMEKSINVNLNFYEQNIPLSKSGTFGLVSGLGLSWNNYRFSKNTLLVSDSSELKGYLMEGVSVRKSKLVNLYLTLPLYFEIQSKGTKTKDKFHLAAGVVGGWRISTHTKLYFNEASKEYRLRDPETNGLLPFVKQTPGSSTRNIVKDRGSFHQHPFKLDASVRAGWGIINLYANYSLTSMFIKDKGPELYPYAIGISLSGW